MNIYNEGKLTLDLTFTHQLVRMGAAKDWNNIQVSLGIDFDYYHYHDLLSLDPLASALFENSSLFSYFAGLVFNNLNERSAPTKACRGRYPTISIRITSSSIKTTILFLFSMPVGRMFLSVE